MNGCQVGACTILAYGVSSAQPLLSSPHSLVCSDVAVIPNSAKDWELGSPE